MTDIKTEPVACNHEWTDDGEHLLVCIACGAQEDHSPCWRDMSSAPRDGTMLRLLVEFEEHSTEDEDQAPTIGANNFDNDEVDEWKFSGWCWTHDHFVEGKGVPVGWLPMFDDPKVTNSTEQPAPVAGQAQCEECKGWGYHENHHEGGGTECGECGGSGNATVAVVMPDVDELAQIIRKVDGSRALGAGSLAEAILEEVARLNGVKP